MNNMSTCCFACIIECRTLRMIIRKMQRRYLVTGSFLILCLLYYRVNQTIIGAYQYKNKMMNCKNSDENVMALKELIQLTHRGLEELNITHFLSYGSLWGSLRYKNPLPWDYDFDLGVLHDEFVKISEDEFLAKFSSLNIQIRYSPYAGNYKVSNHLVTGDIMIWRDWYNNGVMQRIGYESYLLFPHYWKFHSFPARLVKKPLPKQEFASVNISVPLGGIEMQKYLYPTNWWKEVLPGGC